MRKSNKPKSASFKADAVQLYNSLGSFEKAAAQAGVSLSALRRWVEQHESSSQEAPSKQDDLEQEVERLRKENKRLLMEREILKKAAAFFAKENY
jgi:transposase